MKALKILPIILLSLLINNNLLSQEVSAKANIIVHDYNPDIVLKLRIDTLRIDINQDGVLDIEFNFGETSTGGYFNVKSLNSNCQFAFFMENYHTDSLTSDSLRWRTDRLEWIDSYYKGKLGLKFTFNGLCYYGWLKGAQVFQNFTNTLTIDKFAFCTIANYPLLWGQTELTGIKELKTNDKIKVFTDKNGNSIKVQADEDVISIKLLDLSGKELKCGYSIQSKNATISTLGIPSGVYLVQVALVGNKVYSEKIVL